MQQQHTNRKNIEESPEREPSQIERIDRCFNYLYSELPEVYKLDHSRDFFKLLKITSAARHEFNRLSEEGFPLSEPALEVRDRLLHLDRAVTDPAGCSFVDLRDKIEDVISGLSRFDQNQPSRLTYGEGMLNDCRRLLSSALEETSSRLYALCGQGVELFLDGEFASAPSDTGAVFICRSDDKANAQSTLSVLWFEDPLSALIHQKAFQIESLPSRQCIDDQELATFPKVERIEEQLASQGRADLLRNEHNRNADIDKPRLHYSVFQYSDELIRRVVKALVSQMEEADT
jgi:hypothetical protein